MNFFSRIKLLFSPVQTPQEQQSYVHVHVKRPYYHEIIEKENGTWELRVYRRADSMIVLDQICKNRSDVLDLAEFVMKQYCEKGEQ